MVLILNTDKGGEYGDGLGVKRVSVGEMGIEWPRLNENENRCQK